MTSTVPMQSPPRPVARIVTLALSVGLGWPVADDPIRGTLSTEVAEPAGHATVRVRGSTSSTHADADGRFEIEGPPDAPAILLVHWDDETFAHAASPDSVVDCRLGEARPIERIAPDRERDLARELLLGVVEEPPRPGEHWYAHDALHALVDVDVPAALALAGEHRFPGADSDTYGLARILNVLAPRSPVEALGLVDEVDGGELRTFLRLRCGAALGGDDEQRILDEELERASTQDGGLDGAAISIELARRLHDAGRAGEASAWLDRAREAVAAAEREPGTEVLRGEIGVVLASFDPSASERWIGSVKRRVDRPWLYARAARRLVTSDAKACREFLQRACASASEFMSTVYARGIVHRMVEHDPELARTIAETHDASGTLLALAALRLFELGRPAAATGMLDAAFAHAESAGIAHTPATAASLIVVSSRVDPAHAPARIGRALALEVRSSSARRHGAAHDRVAEAAYAIALAPVDGDLATAFAERAIAAQLALESADDGERYLASGLAWAAIAEVDPERAAALAREAGPHARARVGRWLAASYAGMSSLDRLRWLGVWSIDDL